MNGTKKLAALVVACIMVAAVGVPLAICDDRGAHTTAKVGGVSPVVETITITPDDDPTTQGVQIDPNDFDTGSKTVTITALVYCANGVGQVDTVSATIDPAITGVGTIAMAKQAGSPGTNKKNYQGTFELPPCQVAQAYTVTVTATHKKAGVAAGINTANFTVTALMAMSTTDVEFNLGADIAPGASATGTAAVKCLGNTAIEFTDASKITWSNLVSTTNASNVIPPIVPLPISCSDIIGKNLPRSWTYGNLITASLSPHQLAYRKLRFLLREISS